MFFQKFKRFLVRCAIFQIILLWSVIKINSVERYSLEFKTKILSGLNNFGYHNNDLAEKLDDPTVLFIYCGFEIIAAIFAIFGSFYGNLLSAILFLTTNIIYFNPFLPESQISLFNTRVELFYNIGVLLSILLCAFYPYTETLKVKDQKDLEVIEYEQEKRAETKRSQKKSTKKKN